MTHQTQSIKPSEQTWLEKIKSAAQLKFEALKTNALQLASECKNINITDETTLSMATQKLGKLNDIIKDVDKRRLEINKPHRDAEAAINELVKDGIVNPCKEAVDAGKEKIRQWNEKAKVAAAEEQKKQTTFHTFLMDVKSALDAKVTEAITGELCEKLIASINTNYPSFEQFGPYANEAREMKAGYIQLLNIRKTTINAAVSQSPDVAAVTSGMQQAAAVLEQQAEHVQVVEAKKDTIAAQVAPVTSKVRKQWKYEVVDETQLPRAFLSPDPAKIRKYQSDNLELMKKGGKEEYTVSGVRFYLDEAPAL